MLLLICFVETDVMQLPPLVDPARHPSTEHCKANHDSRQRGGKGNTRSGSLCVSFTACVGLSLLRVSVSDLSLSSLVFSVGYVVSAAQDSQPHGQGLLR